MVVAAGNVPFFGLIFSRAINTFKFKEYPPKDTEMYLEYTDVDGEKNGAYQTKKIRIQDLGKEGKVTLLKEEKKEEE